MKKNPFASARDLILKLELEFQKILCDDVWMTQGCIVTVEQKNHSHRQRTEKHVCSSQRLRNWTAEQGRRILRSDESKFNLKGSGGKRNARKPVGKRLHN